MTATHGTNEVLHSWWWRMLTRNKRRWGIIKSLQRKSTPGPVVTLTASSGLRSLCYHGCCLSLDTWEFVPQLESFVTLLGRTMFRKITWLLADLQSTGCSMPVKSMRAAQTPGTQQCMTPQRNTSTGCITSAVTTAIPTWPWLWIWCAMRTAHRGTWSSSVCSPSFTGNTSVARVSWRPGFLSWCLLASSWLWPSPSADSSTRGHTLRPAESVETWTLHRPNGWSQRPGNARPRRRHIYTCLWEYGFLQPQKTTSILHLRVCGCWKMENRTSNWAVDQFWTCYFTDGHLHWAKSSGNESNLCEISEFALNLNNQFYDFGPSTI